MASIALAVVGITYFEDGDGLKHFSKQALKQSVPWSKELLFFQLFRETFSPIILQKWTKSFNLHDFSPKGQPNFA